MEEKTEVAEPVVEAVADAPAPEAIPAKAGVVVGEVHIIAGPDGGIQVSAPPNIVVAFGLLEAAKMILTDRQHQIMKQAQALCPPAIVKAGADALKNLGARK